jgi:hypothetical protein
LNKPLISLFLFISLFLNQLVWSCESSEPLPRENTRADIIRSGLGSIHHLVQNPPIPVVSKRVTSLDNHTDVPNKPLVAPMELTLLKLPSGGVIGLQSIFSWKKWYKQVMGQLINEVKQGRRTVPKLYAPYANLLEPVFDLLPETIPLHKKNDQIYVNRPAITPIEEALMERWLKENNIGIPFPKRPQDAKTKIIVVPILPGMALTTSGIGSTFGWHLMLNRIEKEARRQGHKVQVVPVSISYPFYGGPVDMKYISLLELGTYVDRIIDGVIDYWISQGDISKDQLDVIPMGRSMGATLAIWLHNKMTKKYPAVIASSPMLSKPDLHLNKAERKLLKGIDRDDAADKHLSISNLDINLLNLSAALIAQSFIEDTLPNAPTGRVLVVWSQLDPEYPDGDIWQPMAVAQFGDKGITPIILPEATAHNTLSERYVFDTFSEILKPEILRVLLSK